MVNSRTLALLLLLAFAGAESEGQPMNDEFLIAIHGGADA